MTDPAADPAPKPRIDLDAIEADLRQFQKQGLIRIIANDQDVADWLAVVAELRIARELLADVGLSHLLVDTMTERDAEVDL